MVVLRFIQFDFGGQNIMSKSWTTLEDIKSEAQQGDADEKYTSEAAYKAFQKKMETKSQNIRIIKKELEDFMRDRYLKENAIYETNNKLSSIIENAQDDTLNIQVIEDEKILSCQINSVSEYTTEELYYIWRKSKNSINEKLDYEIPKEGTTTEKITQLFDDNNGVLFVRNSDKDADNGEIYRFVLVDFESANLKNFPSGLRAKLKEDKKKYSLFCTFTSRDDASDWRFLSPWHWQEINPYAHGPQTHYYSSTKKEAIDRYIDSGGVDVHLLKELVKNRACSNRDGDIFVQER